MRIPSALIKLCAASLLVGGTASLDLVASKPAYAGCGNYSANGWLVNASTGETITTLGTGEVAECGNMSGSLAYFNKQGFNFGWEICYQHCQDGWQPNTLYVEVNGTRRPGKVIDPAPNSSDSSCVQPSGSQIQYCWE